MRTSHRRRLNRERTLRFLEELGASPEAGVSLYLPAGMPEEEAQNALNEAVATAQIASYLGSLACPSRTGAVLFWGTDCKILVLPPFPLGEKFLLSGYNVDPLQHLLEQELTIGLVLLRLGEYAIGIFRGEHLLTSKHGTGLVHSRHKKGGSSQGRFERHREKQMESYFTRVCAHARNQLEPYETDIDYLVYGSERNTLLKFRRQCSYLKRFDSRTRDSLLDIRHPNRAALKASIENIWSSEVIEFAET
ncbi:MAG: Vms1/Ankzf1 family peptidyl-tRNA hydrolase [Dehalococcoidia bacterium]